MNVVSYAQTGEDLQLAYLLGSVRGKTYIDIGCLWPKEHSNSFFFYERGGSGLCVDANPTLEDDFLKTRPRDVFVNSALGEQSGSLTYHVFRNPVFNTFSADIAAKRQAQAEAEEGQVSGRALIETVDIPVTTLDEVVQTAMPGLLEQERIDFLSIDVEGFELEVLRGFSFHPRPQVILAEELLRRDQTTSFEALPLASHLFERGYALAGYLGHNLYFRDES